MVQVKTPAAVTDDTKSEPVHVLAVMRVKSVPFTPAVIALEPLPFIRPVIASAGALVNLFKVPLKVLLSPNRVEVGKLVGVPVSWLYGNERLGSVMIDLTEVVAARKTFEL